VAAAGIRIEDLGDPQLSDEQRAIIDVVSRMSITLSEDAVLSAAKEQTGLHDFGCDDFIERLRIWLLAIDEDAELGPVGRMGAWNDCVRYAANRLRFEDLMRRHPEIDDEVIAAPIIIVGLPRSGTTHLLNLIAADTRLRSLPYWESLEPIPDAAEHAGPDGLDPRLLRSREASKRQDALMPLLRNMHHMTAEHVHEEIEVQALDFSSYQLEWIARVPRWRDYYLSHDQRPHYAYLVRVLKALQWMRGPNRWILKSPQHLEQLGPLMDAFPDATVAFTHRDPVAVITSAITMLAYGSRLGRTKVDPGAIAAYWIDRIERLLRACVRDREKVPPDQGIDVLFHEFMADDIAMVERIYDLAGLPVTRRVRAELGQYLLDNPRGKHGRILYDLEADFGVDPNALRERFGFYFDRFAVRAE
jgi:hypothetical protein